MGTAEDSATEVGSIGSRHKATLNSTPASASLHNVSEKQPAAAETTEQISVDDEKAAANDASPATPDEDDGVEYPVAWKLGLITIALCLSVFCVALVRIRFFLFRLPPPKMKHQLLLGLTNQLSLHDVGQHHHRHRHPPHHRRVQRFRPRHWLVRRRLPANHLRRPAHLWQALHLLLGQVGLPLCHPLV
jgi:hypothetical protein